MHILRATVVALLGGAGILRAQASSPIAKYVPAAPDPAHVFVLDSAHILSPATIAALQDSARVLQTETGADVAWVTLPTLGGRPIEEAALYIGREWKIGTPGQPGDPMRNRGLVVLYVPDKTKTAGPNFRIEVGKGLEGTITDSRSRSITTAMRSGLKAKTYDEAYVAGWTAAAQLVREDFTSRGSDVVAAPTPSPLPIPEKRGPSQGVIVALWFVLVAGVVTTMIVVSQQRRRRRVMRFNRRGSNGGDDDDERRRRPFWTPVVSDSSSSDSSSGSSSSSSDSGSSSGSSSGGDFGGGGGFDGGGSSDTI